MATRRGHPAAAPARAAGARLLAALLAGAAVLAAGTALALPGSCGPPPLPPPPLPDPPTWTPPWRRPSRRRGTGPPIAAPRPRPGETWAWSCWATSSTPKPPTASPRPNGWRIGRPAGRTCTRWPCGEPTPRRPSPICGGRWNGAATTPAQPDRGWPNCSWSKGGLKRRPASFAGRWRRIRTTPASIFGLARVESQGDDLPACLSHLERAAADPHTREGDRPPAAEVHQRLGDAAAAERDLRAANDLPDDAPWPDPLAQEAAERATGLLVRVAHANQLLMEDRVPEAVALLQEIVQDYPDAAHAWFLLGKGWMRENNLDGAEAALRRGDPAGARRRGIPVRPRHGAVPYADSRPQPRTAFARRRGSSPISRGPTTTSAIA